jgi:hypothetical protein
MFIGEASETKSQPFQAAYAQALMLDGRLDEALTVARPLFDDESVDPLARLRPLLSSPAATSSVTFQRPNRSFTPRCRSRR